MASFPSPLRFAVASLRGRADAAQGAALRLLARLTPTDQSRVFAVTLVAGGLCGLVAVSFHLAIRVAESMLIDRFPVDAGYRWIPWVLLVPTLGGLAAGLALQRFPGARGSGIPQVEVAYAVRTSKLRLRDAVAKFFICALQVGSGASLGREGPTVQICAAVAAFVGRVAALSPSNQRRLIPVGAAAGVAAAFNAPLAAVTFVIEELVGGLDTTVLSGVVIAAALAAVVEHGVLGEDPIFQVPGSYGLAHASSLVLYAGLGVAAGLLGVAFVRGLLGLRTRFRSAERIPAVLQPALGGLGTGALAVLVAVGVGRTGVTGGGYATLVEALHGGLLLRTLAVLCVAKGLATILSYSSGGAGGIFAPSLFVGAMLGGLVGHADVALFGHEEATVGAFALVGMGAFFAAVVRAPITSILIVFEMTRSYRLVLPLMIANMVAYLISRRLQRLPIYEALLEQDGVHLPHARSNALAAIGVDAAMTRRVVSLEADLRVEEALVRVDDLGFASYPVIDGTTFRGVITGERLRRLVAEGHGASLLAEQARTRETLHARQTLRDALEVMNRLGVRTMVVVDRDDRTRVLGMLAMSDVMRTLLAHEPAPESTTATGTPYPVRRNVKTPSAT